MQAPQWLLLTHKELWLSYCLLSIRSLTYLCLISSVSCDRADCWVRTWARRSSVVSFLYRMLQIPTTWKGIPHLPIAFAHSSSSSCTDSSAWPTWEWSLWICVDLQNRPESWSIQCSRNGALYVQRVMFSLFYTKARYGDAHLHSNVSTWVRTGSHWE